MLSNNMPHQLLFVINDCDTTKYFLTMAIKEMSHFFPLFEKFFFSFLFLCSALSMCMCVSAFDTLRKQRVKNEMNIDFEIATIALSRHIV